MDYITQQLIATERKVKTSLKKVLIHFLHLTVQFFAFGPLGRNHNRRQNLLKHFALRGLSEAFYRLRKDTIKIPSPIPSTQCYAAVQAACRKQQNTPTLNGRKRWGEGGGGGLFCFLKLHYLSTMSQKFCCRLLLKYSSF